MSRLSRAERTQQRCECIHNYMVSAHHHPKRECVPSSSSLMCRLSKAGMSLALAEPSESISLSSGYSFA